MRGSRLYTGAVRGGQGGMSDATVTWATFIRARAQLPHPEGFARGSGRIVSKGEGAMRSACKQIELSGASPFDTAAAQPPQDEGMEDGPWL